MDTLRVIQRSSATAACILAIAVGVVSGCKRIDPQADAEAKFALQVITWFKLYDVESSVASVTNLAQVFPLVKHGYPYCLHRDLSRFGKNSGFSISLAEKYVFFSPHVTNLHGQGSVICMSAQPFPLQEGQLGRLYISKSGSSYSYAFMQEKRVETDLREAMTSAIRSSTVRPPPVPSPEAEEELRLGLLERIDRFAWKIAGALGQDSVVGVRAVLLIILGLVMTALVWISVRRWRSSD